MSATRSLIAGNGAAIDLDEGLPCNGMVDTIAAVVADFAAVHNEPDTRPVGLAADLDTVARVAGNLTAVHGEIGSCCSHERQDPCCPQYGQSPQSWR